MRRSPQPLAPPRQHAHDHAVITANDVIPLLLDACPSFLDRWATYTASSIYEESLLYVHLGEFAHHLVELAKHDTTTEFAAVFDAVERLHIEGDSYVKKAATIGLLENVQNIAGHAGVTPNAFERHLKPESERWWAELNRFWSGQIPYVGAGLQRSG